MTASYDELRAWWVAKTPDAPARKPRCDWADCTRPAWQQEGGWKHCKAHLREHREMLAEDAPKRPGRPTEKVPDARIVEFHALGLSDMAAARALGLAPSTYTRRRWRLGLPSLRDQQGKAS